MLPGWYICGDSGCGLLCLNCLRKKTFPGFPFAANASLPIVKSTLLVQDFLCSYASRKILIVSSFSSGNLMINALVSISMPMCSNYVVGATNVSSAIVMFNQYKFWRRVWYYLNAVPHSARDAKRKSSK